MIASALSSVWQGPLAEAPTTSRVLAGTLIPVDSEAAPEGIIISAESMPTEPVHFHSSTPVSHVLIHLQPHARATIVLWLEGEAAALRHTTEVIAEEGSIVTVLCVNGVAASSVVTIRQQSTVAAGASVRWQQVSLGGAILTHDLLSRVTGEQAESAVDWMFYAKGSEQCTLTVRNVFDGARGSGEVLMRGVAEERGHGVCRGTIDIGRHGNGTNTYLTQEVLMLDATAKIDAVPGLEIKTNDVKASHSATVARVTPEDLFYFSTRGIPAYTARAMFVQGFLGQIADRILDQHTRETVQGMIEKKYAL